MTAGRSGNPIPNLQPFFWLRLPEDGEAGAGADWPRCCRKPPPDFPNAQRRVRARRVPPLISCSFHLQGGRRGERGREREMGFHSYLGCKRNYSLTFCFIFCFCFFFSPLSVVKADSIRINLQGHSSKEKNIICRLLRIRIFLAGTFLENPFSVRIWTFCRMFRMSRIQNVSAVDLKGSSSPNLTAKYLIVLLLGFQDLLCDSVL